MSSPEFLSQVRPAEVLARSHPAARPLHPGPSYLGTEAGRLSEAGFPGDSRPHCRPHAGDRIALSPQGFQEALLPVDGIPDGPLAGRQPVEPARGGHVPRGAGRLRRQPRRGAGKRERCRAGQRRPGASGGLLPGIAGDAWACPASATASITNTASSGRRSSTAFSARSPTAGRPTALPFRSSIRKKRSTSRCTARSRAVGAMSKTA